MKPFFRVCLLSVLLLAFLPESNASFFQTENDKSIKIGFLISSDKSAEAKNGALLAIQKANLNGGYNNKSFELVVRSMEGPWGTGSKQAVDLIFEEKVVALIGSCDGRNAHLVEQAAAKTRFVFLSSWSTDPTLSQAFVPWYFSVVPNDIQQANSLEKEIYKKRKISKVILVSDSSYDSKLSASNFVKSVKSSGKADPVIYYYKNSNSDFIEISNQIIKSDAEAIIFFGQSSAVSKMIKLIKLKNKNLLFYASLNILGKRNQEYKNFREFEDITIQLSGPWFNQTGLAFRQEYLKHYGTEPGLEAAYAYDAVILISDAVKSSGTEYERIKEWLVRSEYEGVTGMIKFDERGNRKTDNRMMVIKNGMPSAAEKK
jgi:branched-chain amino acid transport system substrate-binding protein